MILYKTGMLIKGLLNMSLDEFLANTVFGIKKINTKDLKLFIQHSDIQYFQQGDFIVKEGDGADFFYIILEGSARVFKQGKYFRELVTVLKAGDIVGLNPRLYISGSLETYNRTADVECANKVKTLKVSLTDMKNALNESESLKQAFICKEQEIILSNLLSFLDNSGKLDVSKIEALNSKSKTLRLDAGKTLFDKGDDARGVYFLLNGTLDICHSVAEGHSSNHIATLTAGTLVGELGVIRETKRNAAAVAKTKCDFLYLPNDAFRSLISEMPNAMRRIKKLKDFRIRPKAIDNIIRHQRIAYDGQKKLILEHPKTHNLLEIPVEDSIIVNLLDGEHCLRDIIKAFPERNNQVKNIDYYTKIISKLIEAGFAICPRVTVKYQDDNEKTTSWKDKLKELLTKEYEFKNISEKMDRFYQLYGRHFCAWYGQVVMASMSLLGLVLFFPLYYQAISHASGTLLLKIFPITFILGWFSLLGHELAHGVATHDSGAKCYKGGIAWYWVSPVGYMDTSLMWTKPLKDRIKVNLAGLYFNLFFASFLVIPAYLGWFNTYFTVATWFFAFGNLLGVMSNLSSLLEYDGYYVLMDLCNMPNLRGKSSIWLLETLPKKIKKRKNPFKGHGREFCYWLYTVAHVIASIMITQLVVVEIIWPIYGIQTGSNWVWDIVRVTLVCLVLWASARTVIQEVKEGKMSG